MTKEQFRKLTPWLQHMRWAAKSNFIHMSTGEFMKVADIYKDIYGEGLTASQMNCNTCRLRALKRLYESYEAELQVMAEEENEEKQQPAENQEIKKKVGRKKKIDID